MTTEMQAETIVSYKMSRVTKFTPKITDNFSTSDRALCVHSIGTPCICANATSNKPRAPVLHDVVITIRGGYASPGNARRLRWPNVTCIILQFTRGASAALDDAPIVALRPSRYHRRRARTRLDPNYESKSRRKKRVHERRGTIALTALRCIII